METPPSSTIDLRSSSTIDLRSEEFDIELAIQEQMRLNECLPTPPPEREIQRLINVRRHWRDLFSVRSS